jgi:hypothetical protein
MIVRREIIPVSVSGSIALLAAVQRTSLKVGFSVSSRSFRKRRFQGTKTVGASLVMSEDAVRTA